VLTPRKPHIHPHDALKIHIKQNKYAFGIVAIKLIMNNRFASRRRRQTRALFSGFFCGYGLLNPLLVCQGR
jgi:hypothetical protein